MVKRRVLIVDDNHDAADSLAMLLSLEGHEVKTAHTGEGALELAPSYGPEFVLLDISMPGMNGYEVARRMRSQAWFRDAKLIAITGWGETEDERQAAAAGFHAHFTKPVDPSGLSALVSKPD